MIRKQPGDYQCYRCARMRRDHIGEELKCPSPPVARRIGDGCYRPCKVSKRRVSLSIGHDTVVFLGKLMSALSRGADVGVMTRSADFQRAAKLVVSAKLRAEKLPPVQPPVWALKTHCVNGHEFTPANSYTPAGTRKRRCRKCASDMMKAIRARKKTEAIQRAQDDQWAKIEEERGAAE